MNLNSLDLNKLLVFSKVVEAGNYRVASEALNVTPSALSQTISSLEHSIGIPLFHRIGKKLVLTEMGQKIQFEFQTHHSSLKQALERLADQEKQVSGLIRIGSYLEFARFQLAPVLAAFQKKHPDVQVKLVFDTPSRLHRMLEQNRLDLCFSIFPERDSRLIHSKPIYQEELVLAGHQELISDRASFEEILEAPMVEYYFNHQPMRRWLMLHFKKRPKDLPIRAFAANAEMVLTLIQEGLGIGIIPEYLLSAKPSKSLVICRPSTRKLIDHIWMLQLKGREKSKSLLAFTEEIRSAFSP